MLPAADGRPPEGHTAHECRMTTPSAALRAHIRGVYVLTPDVVERTVWQAACEAALNAGARLVQYRDKHCEPDERLERAHWLSVACHARGAVCIVNDDPSLMVRAGADGVHLGRDDAALPEVRRAYPDKLIGASCYDSLARARMAVAAGADYVAFGSVFASSTKPFAPHAPLSLLGQAATLGVPVVAIGGITLDNVAPVFAAGAHACAIITGVFGAPLAVPADIDACMRRWLAETARFSTAPPS